jgi:hypothetical protein
MPHTIPHKHDKNQGKKKYFLPIKNPASERRKPGFLSLGTLFSIF